jgi:hypothetical protein
MYFLFKQSPAKIKGRIYADELVTMLQDSSAVEKPRIKVCLKAIAQNDSKILETELSKSKVSFLTLVQIVKHAYRYDYNTHPNDDGDFELLLPYSMLMASSYGYTSTISGYQLVFYALAYLSAIEDDELMLQLLIEHVPGYRVCLEGTNTATLHSTISFYVSNNAYRCANFLHSEKKYIKLMAKHNLITRHLKTVAVRNAHQCLHTHTESMGKNLQMSIEEVINANSPVIFSVPCASDGYSMFTFGCIFVGICDMHINYVSSIEMDFFRQSFAEVLARVLSGHTDPKKMGRRTKLSRNHVLQQLITRSVAVNSLCGSKLEPLGVIEVPISKLDEAGNIRSLVLED